MQITSAAQYREAVAEASRLDQAREGTPEFDRRHELLAAIERFEQSQQTPEMQPGRPPSSTWAKQHED